jgi:hypothetical protein
MTWPQVHGNVSLSKPKERIIAMGHILQPLLGSDKSNPLLEVMVDPETPDQLLVLFATELLETVPKDRNAVLCKMLGGRLYNAGFNRQALSHALGWSRQTLGRFGQAEWCLSHIAGAVERTARCCRKGDGMVRGNLQSRVIDATNPLQFWAVFELVRRRKLQGVRRFAHAAARLVRRLGVDAVRAPRGVGADTRRP